jgi:hypothetical protein
MWLWVLPNILGIVTYFYFSSWTWIPPGEPVGGPGDPIIWMLTAFPVLAACSFINLIWLICILVGDRKNWKLTSAWLLIVMAWYAAYRYDVYRTIPSGSEQPASIVRY